MAARIFLPVVLGVVVVGVGGCPDRTPPRNVSGFTATEGDTSIDLSWTNPTNADFAGVIIVRSTDDFPENINDGDQVFDGTSVLTTDTGLTNGTTYYYTAFAYDADENYSSGATASAIPTVGTVDEDIAEEFDTTAMMIDMADIPEDARDLLMSSLEDAEEMYRAGDACGAADQLNVYEDDAQDLRQAAAGDELVGTFEELYVAGRRVRYDMLLTLEKPDCPGHERVGDEVVVTVDETASDNTQLELAIEFGEPRLLTVRHEGEVFTNIEIPGTDSLTGEPGAPAVPIFRRLIAVPQGATVQMECTFEEAETIFLNVLPTQESPVDQLPDVPGQIPDASFFGSKPFTINAARYGVDEAFPAEPCTMTDLGEMRDIRTFLVEVPAARYNALSDTVTLLRNINISTTFAGGTGMFATERLISNFEPQAYASAYLNENILSRYLDIVDLFQNLGQEFMILTPPAFRTAADTLATWKNSKGIVTRVFEVGTGTTIDTVEEIQQLIRDEFEDSTIRPAYVLLLGNTAFIPCDYVTPNGDVGSETIGTDWPYTAFGLFGILPQLALGRLPVRSLADATRVVDRIVAYEDTPPFNSNFYNRAAIAAQFQCCYWEAYSIGTLGTDQRTFILTAEFARNVMRAAGKTVDRIYDQTNDPLYEFDTTPRRYHDGTALPAELGPGSGFDWSNGAAEISAAWNAGRFLVLHRDHGWPGGWGNPPFDWANADSLTNGNLLPVVFSVNCASGLFDQETAGGAIGTSAGIPYFSERLLTNPNGGAIGILGDTRNSPTWANSALTRGFFDAIWPTALPEFGTGTAKRRLGDILNHGKLYLFSQGGLSGTNITWSDVGDEFKMWHALGDPTLEIWTTNPNSFFLDQVVTVSFANSILLAEYGTEGAMLTAYQLDPNLRLLPLGRGTVVGGEAEFELVGNPQQGAPVFIAASLENAVSAYLETTVTGDTTGPGSVRNLSVMVPDNQIVQATLEWTNPEDVDLLGVRIQRKLGSFPTSPDDGTTVFDDFASQFVDNTVSNNNDYYYAVYAYDTNRNYAPAALIIAEVFVLVIN